MHPKTITAIAAAVLFTLSSPQTTAQDRVDTSISYKVYVVKWYETLDDVADKFGVSKEILMHFNGLSSEKLSRKQKLRIPDDPSSVALPPQPADSTGTAMPHEAQPGEASMEHIADDGDIREYSGRVNTVLMLPFRSGTDRQDQSAYDFYSGVLLAVKDLKDAGIETGLTVMDSESDRASWFDMLGADLVLGPIAPAAIDSVRKSCPKGCAIISPLDPKGAALALAYSNVIQAPAPVSAQNEEIVRWIREDMRPEDRLVVLREKGVRLAPIMDVVAASGIEFREFEYGILEGRSAIERIEALMGAEGTNRILIASDNEAFVNDALRNCSLMKFRGFDVVLYSHSKIRSFETIEAENLHNVHAHISCGYFVDYNDASVKSFIKRYRALFGTEPTPFAYQGYDTARYFIQSFATSGSLGRRLECMEDVRVRGLQSDFQMSRSGEGWTNSAVRRVVYGDNYSISLL